MFEIGVERILERFVFDLSLFPAFISPPQFQSLWFLPILREHREIRLEKELGQRGKHIDDEGFDAKIEAVVNEDVQKFCVKPLLALTPSDCPEYPWIATSSEYAHQQSKFKF